MDQAPTTAQDTGESAAGTAGTAGISGAAGAAGPDAGLRIRTRTVERPADAGWTLVGSLDDERPARVDGGGLVSPHGADWTLDWWIGADDRWYLPAREPSVRQRRIGAGPVIETAMRVPSGDVTATAYPVLTGGVRATAVEIRNDSPVPVALAVALRPMAIDGTPSPGLRLERHEQRVTVDGQVALVLPRSPNEAGASTTVDQVGEVEAGRPLRWSTPVEGPEANAVCLFPLPHDTTLRVTVLGPGDADAADPALNGLAPSALPGPEDVARGWSTVVDGPASVELPDPGLTAQAAAARSRLVLAAPGLAGTIGTVDRSAAEILEALALSGHADECLPAIEALARSFPSRLPPTRGARAGLATVRAAVAAAELHPAPVAQALLDPMAQLTTLIERSGDGPATVAAQRALARLAARAGQPEAAHHLWALAHAGPAPAGRLGRWRRRSAQPDQPGHRPPPDAPATGEPLDAIVELAQQARPAGSWPVADEARPAARFWTLTRNLLVGDSDSGGDSDGDGDGDSDGGGAGEAVDCGGDDAGPGLVIRLLPTMPAAWLGGPIEVHRLPVAGRRVSFAVRWHGYRPALLWEVDPGDIAEQDGRPVRLTCPGLDPEWSTTERSGEALLAGSPDPLPPAPEPGESFS